MDTTETQLQILALVADRISQDGLPPSQAEIAQAMGFAGVRAAQYHLEALEAQGAVYKIPGKARGLRVTSTGFAMLGRDTSVDSDFLGPVVTTIERSLAAHGLMLPVLGRVAAGVPIGADVHSDEQLLFDRVLFSLMPDYLLRVKGDSMIDEGIFDGDLAVALERAAAFCRVVATGRASLDDGDVTAAAAMVGTAEDLEASARLWRAGSLD